MEDMIQAARTIQDQPPGREVRMRVLSRERAGPGRSSISPRCGPR